MNIILINEKTGVSKNFRISKLVIALVFLLLSGLVAAAVLWSSNEISNGALVKSAEYGISSLRHEVGQQRQLMVGNKEKAEQHIRALTMRMSEIQARLIRLDALGERLVEVAGLPPSEFEFSSSLGLGGPTDVDLGDAYQKPDFIQQLDDMLYELELREEKIAVLEKLIRGDKFRHEAFIAGSPVERGWKSSNYGRRTDPFTGRLAWHKGVDFAGKHGSNVLAVAGGVVTWSGYKKGYGNLVEINHGGGYSTRYGHNSENIVTVGEVVGKGDVVAKMGTTGRSTGPHVHFEVLLNNKQVNPSKYIRRVDLAKKD